MDFGQFGRGLLSGVMSNNPLTMAVNTGSDVVDLAGMGTSMFGRALGVVSPDQMYTPIDRGAVPMSSQWLDRKAGVSEDSGSALAGGLVGGLVNPGKAITKTGLFGGANSRSIPDSMKEAFNHYKQTGKAPDKLPMGMYVGVDGVPRYEISDNLSMLIKNKYMSVGDYKLKDVLHHPELLAAYPGIGRLPVKVVDDPAQRVSGGLRYDANSQPFVMLNTAYMKDAADARNTLLHELQHVIQSHRERFAGGGNVAHAKSILNTLSDRVVRGVPEVSADSINASYRRMGGPFHNFDIRQWNSLPDSEKNRLAFFMYAAKPGEAEARLVESRSKLSTMERLQRPPDFTGPQAHGIREHIVPVLYEDLARKASPLDPLALEYSHGGQGYSIADFSDFSPAR